MKFFSNLPKTSFSSSIGSFTISDFFTYLDVDRNKIDITTVNIDNKTTLVEAGYRVYNDVNSLWAFVAANETINPFDLLAPNSNIYSQQNIDKINLLLFSSAGATTGSVAFQPGSIIVPYVGNTGASYQLGVTGNFDVNGPFAIVEATSFYDGNMIIGPQYLNTFINVTGTADHVTVIQKNIDGSYQWAGSYYTKNKKTSGNRVIQIIQNTQAQTIYRETTAGNYTIDSVKQAPNPVPDDDNPNTPIPVGATAATITYTVQQSVNRLNKQIQAYVPSQLGLVQTSFVTTKYN
jgi:hypothetical protein